MPTLSDFRQWQIGELIAGRNYKDVDAWSQFAKSRWGTDYVTPAQTTGSQIPDQRPGGNQRTMPLPMEVYNQLNTAYAVGTPGYQRPSEDQWARVVSDMGVPRTAAAQVAHDWYAFVTANPRQSSLENFERVAGRYLNPQTTTTPGTMPTPGTGPAPGTTPTPGRIVDAVGGPYKKENGPRYDVSHYENYIGDTNRPPGVDNSYNNLRMMGPFRSENEDIDTPGKSGYMEIIHHPRFAESVAIIYEVFDLKKYAAALKQFNGDTRADDPAWVVGAWLYDTAGGPHIPNHGFGAERPGSSWNPNAIRDPMEFLYDRGFWDRPKTGYYSIRHPGVGDDRVAPPGKGMSDPGWSTNPGRNPADRTPGGPWAWQPANRPLQSRPQNERPAPPPAETGGWNSPEGPRPPGAPPGTQPPPGTVPPGAPAPWLAPLPGTTPTQTTTTTGDALPGDVVAAAQDTASAMTIRQMAQTNGWTVSDGPSGTLILRVPVGSEDRVIGQLQQARLVRYAERNRRVAMQETPGDEGGHPNIPNAPAGGWWDTGGKYHDPAGTVWDPGTGDPVTAAPPPGSSVPPPRAIWGTPTTGTTPTPGTQVTGTQWQQWLTAEQAAAQLQLQKDMFTQMQMPIAWQQLYLQQYDFQLRQQVFAHELTKFDFLKEQTQKDWEFKTRAMDLQEAEMIARFGSQQAIATGYFGNPADGGGLYDYLIGKATTKDPVSGAVTYKRMTEAEWVTNAQAWGLSPEDSQKLGRAVTQFLATSRAGVGPSKEELQGLIRSNNIGLQPTLDNRIQTGYLDLAKQVQLGQLAVATGYLDLAKAIQGGQLDLAKEIQRGQLVIARDTLTLSEKIQRGQLDIARDQFTLSAEIERARQKLAEELGRGQLGVQIGQLDLARQQFGFSKEQFDFQKLIATAGITGEFNGRPTLDTQRLAQNLQLALLSAQLQRDLEAGRISQQEKDRALAAEIQRRGMSVQEGDLAIRQGQFEFSKQMQTAALTGTFEGAPTLAAQQLAQAKELALLADKLTRDVEAGRISQQEKDRALAAEIQRRGMSVQEGDLAIRQGQLELQKGQQGFQQALSLRQQGFTEQMAGRQQAFQEEMGRAGANRERAQILAGLGANPQNWVAQSTFAERVPTFNEQMFFPKKSGGGEGAGWSPFAAAQVR